LYPFTKPKNTKKVVDKFEKWHKMSEIHKYKNTKYKKTYGKQREISSRFSAGGIMK
jgi:hypothetical protein